MLCTALSVALIVAKVAGAAQTLPSSEYKRLFLGNEKQSCADISDPRQCEDVNECHTTGRIAFCSLPVSEENVEYTLTFWGWDQGLGYLKSSVMVYAVNTEDVASSAGSNITLLATIGVPDRQNGNKRPKNDVQWLRRRILLTTSEVASMSEIKLYYHVGGGGGHELDLRDVWFRPTAEDNGDPPSRMCSKPLFVISVFTACLCGVFILLAVIFKQKVVRGDVSFASQPLAICWVVASGVFSAYTNGYPDQRCKNDTYFVVALTFGCLGPAAFSLFYLYSRNKRNRGEAVHDETELTEHTHAGNSASPAVVLARVVDAEEGVVQARVVDAEEGVVQAAVVVVEGHLRNGTGGDIYDITTTEGAWESARDC